MATNPVKRKYKRRRVLQWGGLATGASMLPVTIWAATTLPQESNVSTAIPAPMPHTFASSTNPHRVVLVQAEDRVADMRQALDLTFHVNSWSHC